jgi:hypothetical protein
VSAETARKCGDPSCLCCHPPDHWCDLPAQTAVGATFECERCGQTYQSVPNPRPHPKVPDVVWRLVATTGSTSHGGNP